MNGNMTALNMIRKPKVEIEETMYPEDLAAQEQQAPMQGQPMEQPPMEQMAGQDMPPMSPEDMEMMRRKQMMG